VGTHPPHHYVEKCGGVIWVILLVFSFSEDLVAVEIADVSVFFCVHHCLNILMEFAFLSSFSLLYRSCSRVILFGLRFLVRLLVEPFHLFFPLSGNPPFTSSVCVLQCCEQKLYTPKVNIYVENFDQGTSCLHWRNYRKCPQ